MALLDEMIENAARLYTGDATPRGCLLASAVATGSKDAADVREAAAYLALKPETVRRLVRRGELPHTRGPLLDLTPRSFNCGMCFWWQD